MSTKYFKIRVNKGSNKTSISSSLRSDGLSFQITTSKDTASLIATTSAELRRTLDIRNYPYLNFTTAVQKLLILM